MVCLYLPIIAVVVYSLDKSADLIGFTGFTTHWYSVAFHDPQVRRDLLTVAGGRGRVDRDLADDRDLRGPVDARRLAARRGGSSTG